MVPKLIHQLVIYDIPIGYGRSQFKTSLVCQLNVAVYQTLLLFCRHLSNKLQLVRMSHKMVNLTPGPNTKYKGTPSTRTVIAQRNSLFLIIF